MRTRIKQMLLAGATVVALGTAGASAALAVGTDSDVRATGPEAVRADRAAVDSVGGGHAVEVQRDDGGWNVKVVRHEPRLERRMDGTSGRQLLEVHLDGDLEPVRIETI